MPPEIISDVSLDNDLRSLYPSWLIAVAVFQRFDGVVERRRSINIIANLEECVLLDIGHRATRRSTIISSSDNNDDVFSSCCMSVGIVGMRGIKVVLC